MSRKTLVLVLVLVFFCSYVIPWGVGQVLVASPPKSHFVPQDAILWPWLRVVWEPLSGKKSHGWMWWGVKPPPDQETVWVGGDPNAKPNTGPIGAFYQPNFGWQKAVVLGCEVCHGWWHLAYKVGGFAQVCDILLGADQAVASLVGPGAVRFFGEMGTGQVVPLEVLLVTTKEDVVNKNILLL